MEAYREVTFHRAGQPGIPTNCSVRWQSTCILALVHPIAGCAGGELDLLSERPELAFNPRRVPEEGCS